MPYWLPTKTVIEDLVLSNMKSELILVDLSDNEIGSATKQYIHEKGLLHRAFSVFIINGDKMLLQKRAYNKYHSGGLWTNACCSHPRKAETLDEAVQRRLLDELGIECNTQEIDSFIYYADFQNIYEYECDHIFIGTYDGDIVPNPEEIDELKWMKTADVETDMRQSPSSYTKWFITAFPIVLNHLKAF